MKTAAIYARVSTEEQVKNTSLKGQLDACREFAVKAGYTVIKEVAEDFSGARLDRPGLGELRDMARDGTIQALVVYEADRLSRRLGHLLLLQEEFDPLGSELLFVNAQEDTSSPEGRMFFQMRGAFGEYEKSKITERFRLGKLRYAKQGKILGTCRQPLGYALVDGKYVIIEEEARIVRLIFEWCAYDRLTLYSIGTKLTEMGYATKSGHTRWLPNSVKAILDNETYAGTFYWNKRKPVLPKKPKQDRSKPRKNEKTSKQLRDRSEWIAVECPPIISRDLFDAAHMQLAANKANAKRNARRSYLLRGMIKCALCGYHYYARTQKAGYSRYYCGGKNNREIFRPNYTGELCPSKYLLVETLDRRVWDYISAQVTDEEKLLSTFQLRGQAQEEEQRRNQGELESLMTVEETLKREQNKMLDLYSQDIITLPALQERLGMIRKKEESVAEAKAEIIARMDKRAIATATTDALREFSAQIRLGIERASKAGVDVRRQLLEMLETEIVIDETDIHISGIITGRLPLFEQSDSGMQLHTTDRHRVRCADTANGCS